MNNMQKANGDSRLTMVEQLQMRLKELEKKEAEENGDYAVTGDYDDSSPIVDLRNNAPAQSSAASFEWPMRFSAAQRAIIGEAVRDARQRKNFTQNQLERLCNYKTGFISTIEHGNFAGLEKAILKKIGHHVGNDFNAVVMEVCDENFAVPVPAKKKVISAMPDDLEEDEERTYRIKGPSFELKCTVSNAEFGLYQVERDSNNECIEGLIYSGPRTADSLFIRAMEKIVNLLKKDL
jgi:transcriptional regulator with XRE-family HTH domain